MPARLLRAGREPRQTLVRRRAAVVDKLLKTGAQQPAALWKRRENAVDNLSTACG